MASNGLVIRSNERHEVSIPARARVSVAHADVVKLSKAAGEKDGWVDVHMIDFSNAGVGLISQTFFPRGSLVEIEVSNPEPDQQETVLIRCEMRVMRVQMTDRRPAYLVGGAFTEFDDESEEQLAKLLDRLSGRGESDA